MITGYKFETEEQALTACNLCSEYYNIPNGNPDEITDKWVNYQSAEMDDPKFYYIIWNDTLTEVLGNPIEFEVTFPANPE